MRALCRTLACCLCVLQVADLQAQLVDMQAQLQSLSLENLALSAKARALEQLVKSAGGQL